MILKDTGITTTVVASALGTSSRNVSALCKHANINPWSKWKPIESNVDTMTLDELKDKRFGLVVLEANTPKELVNKIKENNDIGVIYSKPRTKFRLGDFRKYNTTAGITVETSESLYPNNEMKIGGIDSTNHNRFEIPIDGVELRGGPTTIGVEDLYSFTTQEGLPIEVRRGAYITDGTNSVWYTDNIYWWTVQMQNFSGKTVDVYEFFTNTKNTPSNLHSQSGDDRFYALPEPHFRLKVTSSQASGIKIAAIITDPAFRKKQDEFDIPFLFVDYTLTFDARGELYTGGEIVNVLVKLSKDIKGFDTISQQKIADRIIIRNETVSETFKGELANSSIAVGIPDMDIFFCVFYNNKLQYVTQPLIDRGDIPIEK